MCSEKIKRLKKQIEDLYRQMPAHSVSPSFLQTIEELEDELADAIAELKKLGEKNA